MPQAQVAAGHTDSDGIGDNRKILENMYPERTDADPARPVTLKLRPGSLDLVQDSGVSFTNLRGIGQADGHAGGKILLADGSTVRTYDAGAATYGSLTGTLAGSDRVQFAFAEVEAAILANGVLHVSDGSAVAAATDADWATLLSDHSQTGFTSVATLGQRALVTYGSRFAFSTTLDFNSTTTFSFYTAESAPDGIVAGVTLGDYYHVFGTQTIETWGQTGLNNDPFRPITSAVIQRGCLARDTIKLLDNSLFFVADDYTVRRLNGQTAGIVSEPWVVRALKAESASDLICSVMEFDNHSFYIINGLNVCLWYDVALNVWFKVKTLESATYDYAHILDLDGTFYGAARSGTKFSEISTAHRTDDKASANAVGKQIVWAFSAHLPVTSGRRPLGSIRLDGSKGVGSVPDVNEDGFAEMRISKDGGNTFGNWRRRSTGAEGEYSTRTIWRRNGRGREPGLMMHFRGNDIQYVYGVAVNDD